MRQIAYLSSFLLLLILAFSSAAKDLKFETITSDQKEIINGAIATTDTHTWMAFLMDEFGEQYCGASLISPTWVLTAAHCFLDEEDQIDLEAGANSIVVLNSDTVSPLASGAVEASIAQIIIHPDYNPDFETSDNAEDFDIAVVELTEEVSLLPVFLLSGDAPTIDNATAVRILGWGTTAIDEEGESIEPSNDLLSATLNIVDNVSCDIIYAGGITDNMLCAGGVDLDDTTDTCQGDSGGPLVVVSALAFVQVGVVSFGGTDTGPACGDPEAPGVYSSVANLASFIADNVADATFTGLDGNPQGPVLSTSVSDTLVTISWTSYADAVSYILYYAPFPEQSPVEFLDLGNITMLSGELSIGSAFYVAIQPVTAQGPLEVFSNVATFSVE
ncbi:MAG: trypsin-like serine protease [Pseudomonadales bacterium]|nr:trypsin-like serine protease [Pseudomonadales bacterium]